MLVNHDILWLDVSVDNVVPLERLKGTNDLRCVKLDPLALVVFAQLHVHLVLDHPVQVLAWQVLKDKVYRLLVCECLMKADYVVQRQRCTFTVVNNVASSLRSVLGPCFTDVIFLSLYRMCVNSFYDISFNLFQKFQDKLFIFKMLNPFGFVYLLFWNFLHGKKVTVVDDQVNRA